MDLTKWNDKWNEKKIDAPALISVSIETHQFDELGEAKEILSIDVKE